MSFNNPISDDLEAASVASAHYQDFPEFESISQSIESTLHNINQNQLIAIRNLVREFESLRESGEANGEKAAGISRKYIELTGICTQAFRGINNQTQRLNTYLNECEANHEDEDTLKYLRQKESLTLNLIKNSLRQFQIFQRKFKTYETEFVERGKVLVASVSDMSLAGQTVHDSNNVQVQITYEPINAEELEQHSLMVEEREREIQQISQDTREINEIFLSLQDIVQEQQFQVDSIEDNILSFSADARGASRELRSAERYQRRSGGRMLCCLLILVGVFGSVILVGILF